MHSPWSPDLLVLGWARERVDLGHGLRGLVLDVMGHSSLGFLVTHGIRWMNGVRWRDVVQLGISVLLV